MQARCIVIPKQSKPTGKKHLKEKCTVTVLDWIRHGYQFPGKPAPPAPPKPGPDPIQIPPTPDNPPRKPGEKGGAQ